MQELQWIDISDDVQKGVKGNGINEKDTKGNGIKGNNAKRNGTKKNDAKQNEKSEKGTNEEREERIRRRRRLDLEDRLRRQRRRRRKQRIRIAIFVLLMLVVVGLVAGAVKLVGYLYTRIAGEKETQEVIRMIEEQPVAEDTRKWKEFYALELERPELVVNLLTVNEYSRPGELLPEVKNVFVHYTANVGTTAEQNRSYFESLAETKERSASAHFVIGFDGTIIQCIPTREIAYAVKQRNYDSISIECCYVDEDGKFTQETYDELIELTAWLLHKYELEPEDVLRHYDEGGKLCPKYYVENEDAWRQFLTDLSVYMEQKITEEKMSENQNIGQETLAGQR